MKKNYDCKCTFLFFGLSPLFKKKIDGLYRLPLTWHNKVDWLSIKCVHEHAWLTFFEEIRDRFNIMKE